MDSIFNNQSELASVIAAAVKQVLTNAKALGLTWALRIATISDVTNSLSGITGTMDGDTNPIGLTNASGLPLADNMRVYVMIVPPAGNFIIGYAETVTLGYACGTEPNMTAGTTGSLSYVAQPGSPSVILTKRFEATYLRFSWSQTYYNTGGDVNALFAAITSSGEQIFLAKNFVATTSGFRTPISGVASLAGVAAGTKTWTGAWATAGGGAGVLTTDSGCFWTMCIEEFWPSD